MQENQPRTCSLLLVRVCFSSLRESRQLLSVLNLTTTVYYTFLFPFVVVAGFLFFLNNEIKVRLFLVPPSPLVLALPQLHHLIPDGEVTSIKITRQDPSDPLAISVVGGNETPLVRILIQDIYREGIIARDGRLLPGDMILKVIKIFTKENTIQVGIFVFKVSFHFSFRLTALISAMCLTPSQWQL